MQKIFFIMFAAGILFFSCGSTPPPADSGAPPQTGAVVDLGTARGRADAAQEKAKAAKANIAVKEDFAQAAAAYAEAQPLAASNPDGAIAKYLEAEKLFLASADAANAKREEAQKQLSKAKSDIKEVEDAAELLKKEQKAEGGSQ